MAVHIQQERRAGDTVSRGTPSGGYIFRSYEQGDEDRLIDMFNEVFRENRQLPYWIWKYRDNPQGSCCISLAVSPEGVLASQYAGYPVCLRFYPPGGKGYEETTTFQIGDKMTRKAFRSVGFGKTSLLAKTFEHFKNTHARNAPFAYGFATHHSLRIGLLFLGYADIEPVHYRHAPVGAIKISARKRVAAAVSRIRVEETTSVDEEWTALFERCAPRYRYLIRRDAAYLRWRYLRRPDRRYLILVLRRAGRLAGWSVFFREGRSMIWGDALFEPRSAAFVMPLLGHAVHHPLAEGIDAIECWFPPRPSWWDRTIGDIGFISEREPRDLHLTGPIFSDHQAPERLKTHLYYTMGDSDLF